MKQFVIVGLDTDEKRRRAEDLLKEAGYFKRVEAKNMKYRGVIIVMHGGYSYTSGYDSSKKFYTLTEARELLKQD